MVAALVAVFGLVLVHVQLTANQLRLMHIQQQADNEEQRHIKLRLELAQLESPQRVVATAAQLGMVPPTTITYLTAAQTSAPVSPAPGWASSKLNDPPR